MVMLLSWTGGRPGGCSITVTTAVMTTVAPDVLMVVLGGELTARCREMGASISAGFYPEKAERAENTAGEPENVGGTFLLTSIMVATE